MSLSVFRSTDRSMFTTITGFERQEVVGKLCSDIPLLLAPFGWPELHLAVAGEQAVINREAPFVDRRGATRAALLSAMTMPLADEPHLLLILREIDALKKAEQALAESEIRFRELFESMVSGVSVFLGRGDRLVLVDMNRAAERIEGVDKQRCLGRAAAEIMAGPDGRDLEKALAAAWETGKPAQHQIVRRENNRITIAKHYHLYKLSSGEVIAVCDDITARKQAEEKLFAYQAKLKNLSSELALVEERERRAIARDLHDQIGQNLSVIKMKLGSLATAVSAPGPRADLVMATDLLQQAIKETRTLTFELSPPILHELGLEAALDWLVENFRTVHHLDCRAEITSLGRSLAEDLQIVLFRAVRELLLNVTKHARARSVVVVCGPQDDHLAITVRDDGAGFDFGGMELRAAEAQGFGLFSIQERLHHLGGSLSVQSSPGCGAAVTLLAPFGVIKEKRS